MKHIIIQVEDIFKYPPTITLLNILTYFNQEVSLVNAFESAEVNNLCQKKGIKLINLKVRYDLKENGIKKLIKIPIIRKSIKEIVMNNRDDSIFWIMTSTTMKCIGSNMWNSRYVLYMYELYEKLKYHKLIPYFQIDLNKLFNNASLIIECEKNRSYIAQALFNLDVKPVVIPNKPYLFGMTEQISLNKADSKLSQINEILKEATEKYVILYQGVIDDERPIHLFSKAVEQLGDKFLLIIMSDQIDKLEYIGTNTRLISFIEPPTHLEITKKADLGILVYKPSNSSETSYLNSLYCAPNKIFEYAMFDIPMIGNNVPGLANVLEEHGVGRCFDSLEISEIKKIIKFMYENHAMFKGRARKYYDSVDNIEAFRKVIEKLQ